MSQIPFLDLGRLHASIGDDLDEAVRRVVHDSAFIGGPTVAAFEEAFAAAHGRAAGAGCGSGTDALALALRALGVGPGDEVVVPSMTFVATAEAVVHVGATPVIADVDPATLLVTEETVDAVRTPRTRAVLAVHLYGHLVPFDALRAWKDDGLLVVEDAAQAHLATWEGEPVGTVGHATCFSVFPGKNLGALGDGGMVLGDDEVVAAVRRLRDHGRSDKYRHDEIGWCSRLDGLQASVLLAKLGHLEGWTARRQAVAARYAELLGEHALPGIELVPWSPGAVHHLLVVRVPAAQRDALRAGLGDRKVATGVHYPIALSQQPSLQGWAQPCPAAEASADRVLSLPIDPLMADWEVDQVVGRLAEVAA